MFAPFRVVGCYPVVTFTWISSNGLSSMWYRDKRNAVWPCCWRSDRLYSLCPPDSVSRSTRAFSIEPTTSIWLLQINYWILLSVTVRLRYVSERVIHMNTMICILENWVYIFPLIVFNSSQTLSCCCSPFVLYWLEFCLLR